VGGVNGYTIRKVLHAPMYLWLRSSPCSNLQHGPTSLTLAKPYMRPPHRHMWAYAGEVQDPTNSNEVRRLLLCVCSLARCFSCSGAVAHHVALGAPCFPHARLRISSCQPVVLSVHSIVRPLRCASTSLPLPDTHMFELTHFRGLGYPVLSTFAV
jgi:hypothetical protein